jgi:spore coat protein U-like protein
MRKLVLGFFAVGLVLAFAGRSLAADTANVTVSATVLSSCGFTSAGDLSFGNIDPGSPGPYTPVVTEVNVQCTNGQAFTITDDGGNNGVAGGPWAMDDGGGNTLPYTLVYDNSGSGIGFGGAAFDVPLNLDGSVTQANAQAAVPGAYNDLVVLTVAP